jgi:integrase
VEKAPRSFWMRRRIIFAWQSFFFRKPEEGPIARVFSLRWSQVDFNNKVIRLDNNVKTPGSTESIPLSQYACDVLRAWKLKSSPVDEYVFPSPVNPGRPISTVKTAWQAALRRRAPLHFRDSLPPKGGGGKSRGL